MSKIHGISDTKYTCQRLRPCFVHDIIIEKKCTEGAAGGVL